MVMTKVDQESLMKHLTGCKSTSQSLWMSRLSQGVRPMINKTRSVMYRSIDVGTDGEGISVS